MKPHIRIGTRESELAVWQANLVKDHLLAAGIAAELVFIRSEGDIDLQTPLYEIGVQGIFTRSLDIALLNHKVDIAVHSMKDVPTQLPKGIVQAAVLERGNHMDLFVINPHAGLQDQEEWDTFLHSLSSDDNQVANDTVYTIATSSIRRKAQWLHHFPLHHIDNLRGNVNTRMRKVADSHWQGAIFAAAGLERVGLRPSNAIEIDWMLPAPAQGAVMVVCREDDYGILSMCETINHKNTALATKIERDFLRALMGGCSTPISAYARIENGQVMFDGSVLSVDGKKQVKVNGLMEISYATDMGAAMATKLLQDGGDEIVKAFKNG